MTGMAAAVLRNVGKVGPRLCSIRTGPSTTNMPTTNRESGNRQNAGE